MQENLKYFLIKQNGDFFELDEEKAFYEERLKSLADGRLLGYFLHAKEVMILAKFAAASEVGAFMRSLNSAFARFRKNLRAARALKKPNYQQLDAQSFAAAAALVAHCGGWLDGSISVQKISLFERVNAIKELQKAAKTAAKTKKTKINSKERKMNIQALSSSAHKELKYHEQLVLTSVAPALMVSEALQAEKDYAMVFTNSETPALVAILGREKNVMLSERTYLPASVANYPFFWVASGEESESLCIDADAPQFKGDGVRLFEPDGSESEFLAQAVQKLKTYRKNQALNEQFIKEILAADVLINKELSVTIEGSKKTLIKGFSVIDRRKLDALSDATLADWARRGHLEFIHAHLRSLRHLNTLAERIIENEDA